MESEVAKESGSVCKMCAVSDCDHRGTEIKFCPKFKETKKRKFKVKFGYNVVGYTEVENVDTAEQAELVVDCAIQKHGLDPFYFDFDVVHEDFEIRKVEELKK